MIVDFHTHIFPPEVIERREEYVRRDPAFAELYGNAGAKLATLEDLLRGMDNAEIDVSVALGFAWSALDDCVRHNEYLLSAAARSGGRVVPFCVTQPRAREAALDDVVHSVAAGARGIGELRPASQGFSLLDSPEEVFLVEAASRLDVPLLLHVSEPLGHVYPGKWGLPLEDFAAFAARHPAVKLVGAHWAGGLPFFAPMPEIRELFRSVWFDTAATGLLYSKDVYSQVAAALGADRILFGSDFPLVSQKRSADQVEAAGLTLTETSKVLSGNAARLLGLR